MKPENAVEAKGITKKFKVYYDKGSSLKERVLFKNRRRHEAHWVLKGIDLEIKKGEAVGLIGKNGCGKSTVLKLLTRIMYPTEGSIEMDGRVSSLLELGAGFHPDMSGRENIYTNASIFGLSHAQIEKRIDAIIRFSELEDFIDHPVRTYSSGMYMRLAFAVAIHVDADILLIDEILAVGDAGFQSKCFEKLKDIKAKGTTIVIVSHVMEQLKNICDRVVWLEGGQIIQDGKPSEVTALYLEETQKRREAKIEADFQEKLRNPYFCTEGAVREGNLDIYFTDAQVRNAEGKQAVFVHADEPMEICMKYHAGIVGKRINFTVNITRDDGVHCFGTSALSGMEESTAGILSKKAGSISMVIEKNHLLKGRYLVDIGIQDLQEERFDYIYNALEFRVKDVGDAQGIVNLPRHWKMDEGKGIQEDLETEEEEF
ncbi:MAG: ABC transporter ATP-binding protein [Eubacterium sp.]|nr:ABC transporter ATP-binding protein [Eubacterium sp.]